MLRLGRCSAAVRSAPRDIRKGALRSVLPIPDPIGQVRTSLGRSAGQTSCRFGRSTVLAVLPGLASVSPVVEEDGVTFALPDRNGRLAGVRLLQELGLPGPLLMSRAGGEWRLRLPLPDVDRMEYLFEIEDRHGRRTTIPDPANPRRAAGAFGDNLSPSSRATANPSG